jgi:hypothetical protein
MRQTIQVDVLATDEATVAEVQGTTYEETYRGDLLGKGYAKKHPNDEHDAETGHALAMARALRELADVYEKRAWERINHPRTYTFANGGYVSTLKPSSVTHTGKFDHQWLDRVLGRGIEKA